MVFESLVSDLLNKFIGDYVENLDKSQLKIGIWGGKLTLKIPWKNLYNEAVVATLDGLYLLVVPGATLKYDPVKEERYQQEAKQKELQRIEETLQLVARREKRQEEKKDTFPEKLATQVIKNLQVKITSIHIRYEDDVSDPQRPLSMGMTLSEISLQTTDENWKTCILNEAAKIIYKLGRLECFCAYWNVNSPIFYRGSWAEIVVIEATVTSLGVSARSFAKLVTFQCGGRGVPELSRKMDTALTGNFHERGLSSLQARGRPDRFTPGKRTLKQRSAAEATSYPWGGNWWISMVSS
ncbi:Vacuolar protein sorting-associated protein 13C [Triplophysa tibetana]|uniref:Vacuolar protein sorting-associated protein 13C n=1 Tax=Triplophysa tibetana TaxID=1572043 RepID=A0A5A9PQN5_9TELE|nr:Vacuolar protein sorting-associated protein 13C [Triplophysa tibetana]